jgi:uncharacterized protein YceK
MTPPLEAGATARRLTLAALLVRQGVKGGQPMRTLLLLLISVALLAGCARPIIMRHADGRTTNCQSSVTNYGAALVHEREAQCINDFKEQGFVRQP